MLDPNQPYEVSYFRRDKLCMLATGNPDPELVYRLMSWANSLAEQFNATLSDPHVLNFPATPRSSRGGESSAGEEPGHGNTYRPPTVRRGAFALIFFRVTSLTLTSEEPLSPEVLLDLIFRLDANRQRSPRNKVKVVGPDWLGAGAGSEPGSTGGPGCKPMPVGGNAAKDNYGFGLGTLSEDLQKRIKEGTGENLIVAIMDTAPQPDLNIMYKRWVTDRPGDEHPLVKRLLGPDRKLTVHRQYELSLEPLKDFKVIGFDYKMQSHVLHVLGLIGSFVPAAEFHICQVLNDTGVGDLECFAKALHEIYYLFKNKPCMINCSVVLCIPTEDAHTKIDSMNDLIGHKILYHTHASHEDKPWLDRQAWLVSWISDLLYAIGNRMIAAAGNDYDSAIHSQRPGTRLPAAASAVLGVSAMPEQQTPPSETEPVPTASYSNLADKPPHAGIVTFGGDSDHGILCMHNNDFDTEPNKNGWCRACGTSYAAPTMLGITAAVLSSLLKEGKQATTQDAIELLLGAQPYKTAEGEDVLWVIQR